MIAIIHKSIVDPDTQFLCWEASMWKTAADKAAGTVPYKETFKLHMLRTIKQFVTDGSGRRQRVDDGRFEVPEDPPDPITGPPETEYVTEEVDRDMAQEMRTTILDYMDRIASNRTAPYDGSEALPTTLATDPRRIRPREVTDLDGTEQDFTR